MKYTFRYKVVWVDGSHHFQNNSLSRFEDSFKEAFTMAHVKGVASVEIYYIDRKIATFY